MEEYFTRLILGNGAMLRVANDPTERKSGLNGEKCPVLVWLFLRLAGPDSNRRLTLTVNSRPRYCQFKPTVHAIGARSVCPDSVITIVPAQ